MARYLDNELPPTPPSWKCKSQSGPSLSDVFSGSLLRMLQNRLRVKHVSNLRLWWGFLQGVKRGCLPAEESFIADALLDHSEVLSRRPGLTDVKNEFTETMNEKLHCLWDRAANGGKPPALRKRNKPLRPKISKEGNMCVPPKTGACFETSRGDGGAHQHLYEAVNKSSKCSERVLDWKVGKYEKYNSIDLYDFTTSIAMERVQHQQQLDMEHGRDLLSMWYTPKTGVREERGNLCPYSFTELTEFAVPTNLNRDSNPNRPGAYSNDIELNDYDHHSVTIIALTEPLKVRTISKGNALKYWLARPVQKMMRETLAKMPQFVLVGTPLQLDHIEWLWKTTDDLVERVSPHLAKSGQQIDLDFGWVVSGDYKGATDGLDINATKAAFEAVLSMLDIQSGFAHDHVNHELTCERYKDILRDVLYEQDLHYRREGQPDHVVKQQNGQLMGSNLSFPILCAINLIGYWMALEEYLGVKIEPHDLPVLINGDDILFRSTKPDPTNPRSFYEIWKRVIRQLGFELSVGKNYVHDTIFTVNSECWLIQCIEGQRSFKKITYLNTGLLTNIRSACREEVRQMSLVDTFNCVLAGSRNKPRTFNRLKHYYLKEVKEWTHKGRFNLCAHQLLGGIGVSSEGLDPNFTRFQRRWAKWNRTNLLSCSTRYELAQHQKIQPVTIREEVGELQNGDSYEIPSGGRPITWLSRSEFDQKNEHEQEELKIRKDLRTLPAFSRPQSSVQGGRLSLPSFRSLKEFKRVVALHQVNLDGHPDQFDYVPCNAWVRC